MRVLFYARDPLTRIVPVMEPAAVPKLDALPVGTAEDGTTHSICLVGRHLLIAGASGAGKGSVLWSLIRALGPGVSAGVVRLRGGGSQGRDGALPRSAAVR